MYLNVKNIHYYKRFNVYFVSQVFQSATQKVKEDQIRQEMEIVKKSLEEAKPLNKTELENPKEVIDASTSINSIIDITKNFSSASDLFALVQASLKSTSTPTPAPIVQPPEVVASNIQPRSFGDLPEVPLVSQETALNPKKSPLLSYPQHNIIENNSQGIPPTIDRFNQGNQPENDRFNQRNQPANDRFNQGSQQANDRFNQGNLPANDRLNQGNPPTNERLNQLNQPPNERFNQGNQLPNSRFNQGIQPPSDRFNPNSLLPNDRFNQTNQPPPDRFNSGNQPPNNRFNNAPQNDQFHQGNQPPNDRFNQGSQPQNENFDQSTQGNQWNARPNNAPFNSGDPIRPMLGAHDNFRPSGPYNQALRPLFINNRVHDNRNMNQQQFGNNFRGRGGRGQGRGGPRGRGRGYY